MPAIFETTTSAMVVRPSDATSAPVPSLDEAFVDLSRVEFAAEVVEPVDAVISESSFQVVGVGSGSRLDRESVHPCDVCHKKRRSTLG